MTFELTCVKKLGAKIAKPTTAVLGIHGIEWWFKW
jgi:hypothetical protein